MSDVGPGLRVRGFVEFMDADGERDMSKTRIPRFLVSAVLALCTWTAEAAPTYQSGHIIDVTFNGDSVLIRLDAAVPDNCAGTPVGWMAISSTYKPMQAFVTGLWMRGDLGATYVTVYTSGIANGYCQIGQIDQLD